MDADSAGAGRPIDGCERPVGVGRAAPDHALQPADPARHTEHPTERVERPSGSPLVRRRRRAPVEEPTDQLNVRAAIVDINTFVDWCERNRFSYREGFGELVKRIA
jgi:hypothetical protein